MGNANDTTSTLYSGFLVYNIGTAKRRQFVRLTPYLLCIDNNEENNMDTEMINLYEITEIKSCKHNQFELYRNNNQTIKFQCNNPTIMQEWISQIKKVVSVE